MITTIVCEEKAATGWKQSPPSLADQMEDNPQMDEHRNNVGDGAQVTHPEQEALSVSEVLSRAADLLEKPGAWTQGMYGLDENGYGLKAVHQLQSRAVCLCTVGALAVAGNAASIRYAEEEADAVHALASFLGISVGGVASWNDAPGRTQAEVVSALRAAARPTQEGA